MAWTVEELVRDLLQLGQGAADRTVVVGGRWGISNVSLAGDGLGPVELDLEDVGLDDQGRASLSAAMSSYVTRWLPRPDSKRPIYPSPQPSRAIAGHRAPSRVPRRATRLNRYAFPASGNPKLQ